MLRNEYRRALIMLRALQSGYSGHVRLERRTTMGSMWFAVSAEQTSSRLYAVLVGRRRDEYYAVALGELQRDSRGQAGLNAGFDPRNIDGRPLEAYQLVGVLSVEGENCDLVLAGNINGSYEMNWAAVRNVACALFVRVVEPRNGMVGLEETEVGIGNQNRPDDGTERLTDQSEAPLESGPADAAAGETHEIRIDVRAVMPEGKEEQTEVANADAEGAGMCGEGENPDGTSINTQTSVLNAFGLLGIDPETEWPEALRAVRTLFEMSGALEEIGMPDYIFVRAPLPENAGYAYCAIGIRAENGKPKSVCYALPSGYSPEPPAGLEGYVWRGSGSDGWWIIFLDAETGEEIEPVP